MADERLSVEVVYADPDEQQVIAIEVAPATTVGEAIAASGMAERFAGVDAAPVGVFGRVVSRDTPVRDGDRIEIYRPLRADPKQARRRRAVKPR